MHTPNSRKQVSLHSLEREMLMAGIVWVMIGAFCILAANAWAAGI